VSVKFYYVNSKRARGGGREVESSLYVTIYHAMKAYWGVEV